MMLVSCFLLMALCEPALSWKTTASVIKGRWVKAIALGVKLHVNFKCSQWSLSSLTLKSVI